MRSMTGYGQATGENGGYRVTVTVRSVNHRYLDLQLRMPEEHRDKEAGLRELFTREFSRGRLEARIEVELLGAKEVDVEVNEEVVERFREAVEGMRGAGLLEEALGLRDLLRLPEAVKVVARPGSWEGEDQELLERVVAEAVASVSEARQREGERLAEILGERLAALRRLVEKLEGMRETARDELAARLRQRVGELLDGEDLAEDRLVQEVALLADRSDVQEELDRLAAHTGEFRELLGGEGPLGKRLDFLSQELLREVNTLAAKSREVGLVRLAVDAKVVCDQLREQVQNVE